MELSFKKRLKELRIEKKLTQKQLANKLNVCHVSVSDWEVRGNEPGYQTLIDIAKIFDVTVGQLLGTEEY